jgi:hypothetical protein
MKIEGGCLCSGLRYELRERPFSLGDCHCVDCRRSSGAPYVTWGTVKRENFVITTGELRCVRFAARVRGFAACCGTHVLFEDPAEPATVDVTIASLDRPEEYRPEKAIWIEDKLPWVILDSTIPAFPKSRNAQ